MTEDHDAPAVSSPRRAAMVEEMRRFGLDIDTWPDLTPTQLETLQAIFASAPDPWARR